MKLNRTALRFIIYGSATIILTILGIILYIFNKPEIERRDLTDYIIQNQSKFLFYLNEKDALKKMNGNYFFKTWLNDTLPQSNPVLILAGEIKQKYPDIKIILGIYKPGTPDAQPILWCTGKKDNFKKEIQALISPDFAPVKENIRNGEAYHYPLSGELFLSCYEDNDIFCATCDLSLLEESLNEAYLRPHIQGGLPKGTESNAVTVELDPDMIPGRQWLTYPIPGSLYVEGIFTVKKLWFSGFITEPEKHQFQKKKSENEKSGNIPVPFDQFSNRTLYGLQNNLMDISGDEARFENRNSINDYHLMKQIENDVGIAWTLSKDSVPALRQIFILHLKKGGEITEEELKNSYKLTFLPETFRKDSAYFISAGKEYLYFCADRKELEQYSEDIKTRNNIATVPRFDKLSKQISEKSVWILWGLPEPEGLVPAFTKPSLYRKSDFFVEISRESKNSLYFNAQFFK